MVRARLERGSTSFRLLAVLVFFGALFLVKVVEAQQATVTRDVNLREQPSAASQRISLLTPPQDLTLLEPDQTNGYYHVQLPSGELGWVWARNVEVSPVAPPTGATTGGPIGNIYDDVDPSWPKPTPNSSTFSFNGDVCGPAGQNGDSSTNTRKNRIDEPAAYYPVTFHAVADLAFPQAPRSRANWTSAQLDEITPVEGAPISLVGYLVDSLNVEGAETTNCGLTQPQEVDWHMYLTEDFVADDGKKHKGEAIVVETTPRIRQNHPKWQSATLSKWVNANKPVRISGWLLLDPEHAADIKKGYRTTIWEIHPILKIEVSNTEQPQPGDWQLLDDVQ
jgi:hypothetical protein